MAMLVRRFPALIGGLGFKLSQLASKNTHRLKELAQLSKKPRAGIVCLFLMALPVAFYFYVIGRDRYQVSSSVVVRKATDTSLPSLTLGSLVSGGNQSALEDARYLRTYLTSPEVLEDLEKRMDFRRLYAQKWPDLYPGVWRDATREQVLEVFRRQINVGLNEVSGELQIATFGFEPKTSLLLNKFLIGQSETFVNRLNQDVFKQQLDFTQQQVGLNARRVQQATLALKQFQRTNQVLNAKAEAVGSEQFIGALEGELAKQRVQLATLQRQFSDPKAPEIESVQAQVQELQQQIAKERGSLVSPTGKNLNEKGLKLAELEANLSFATDLYKTALTASEKTRVDSLQQQRFMAVLSKPLPPEEPWQYWRHKGFLTALATVLVGFALTKFLLGMADSHRN
jgi:capsular polysaccharide transport system permease protein